MSKILTIAKKEFLEILPTTIFFFFAFHLIVLTNALFLREYGIDIANHARATIGALLVAKAILVADKLPWINRFPHKPLIYNVIWKTLIYVGCTFVVRLIEHLFPFLLEHKSLALAWQLLFSEIVWPRFWAVQIWLLVLILVYSAGRELVRALGSERLYELFFRQPLVQD